MYYGQSSMCDKNMTINSFYLFILAINIAYMQQCVYESKTASTEVVESNFIRNNNNKTENKMNNYDYEDYDNSDWVHIDDVPNLDQGADALQKLMDAFCGSGNVEDAYTAIETLSVFFDMPMPDTDIAMQKIPHRFSSAILHDFAKKVSENNLQKLAI